MKTTAMMFIIGLVVMLGCGEVEVQPPPVATPTSELSTLLTVGKFNQARVELSSDKPTYLTGETVQFTARVTDALQGGPITYGALELVAAFPDGATPLAFTPVNQTDYTALYGPLNAAAPNILRVSVFQTDTILQAKLLSQKTALTQEIQNLKDQLAHETNLLKRAKLKIAIRVREVALADVERDLQGVKREIGSSSLGLVVYGAPPVIPDPCAASAQTVTILERTFYRKIFPSTEHRTFTATGPGQICLSIKNDDWIKFRRVTNATVKVDDSTVVSPSEFGSNVTYIEKRKAVTNGNHDLAVKINEPFFGHFDLKIKFLPDDTTPPSIQITQPQNGSTLSSIIGPINITYSDNVGINPSSLTVTLNGKDITKGFAASSSAASAQEVVFAEGTNTIVATIRDLSGNPATATATATVLAGTNPCNAAANTTSIFGPQRFKRYIVPKTETFAFAALSAGVACLRVLNGDQGTGQHRVESATLRVDGETVYGLHDFSENARNMERPISLATGTHSIDGRVTVLSCLGSYFDAEILFLEPDTTPPVIQTVTFDPELKTAFEAINVSGYPLSEPKYLNVSTSIVRVKAGDPESGVQSVTGNGIPAVFNGTEYEAALNLADGLHQLSIEVVNGRGLLTSQDAEVVVDTVVPQPPVPDIVPAIIGLLDIQITGRAEPNTKVVVEGGRGMAIGDSDGSGVFKVIVPLNLDALNTLTLKTYDAASNGSGPVSAVIEQNAPPIITVTVPALRTMTTDSTVTITGKVTDTDLSNFTINGVPTPTGVDGSFVSGSLGLNMGYNPFDLVATDGLGTQAKVKAEVFRAATTADLPSAFGFIEKTKGGIVFGLDRDEASFGTSLEVPPNSLTADAVVTLEERISGPLRNPGYLPVGPQIEVEIFGAVIVGTPGNLPIVTVPYRADLVDAAGEFHHTVQVFHISDGNPPVLTGLDILRVDPTLGLVRAAITSTSRFQAFYKNPDFYIVTTLDTGLDNPSDTTYDPVGDRVFYIAGRRYSYSDQPVELWMRSSSGALTLVADMSDIVDVWIKANFLAAVAYWKPNTLLLGISSDMDGGAVLSVDVTDPQAPVFAILAGTGFNTGLNVPDATQAWMNSPRAMAPVSTSRFYVAESDGMFAAGTPNDVVRVVDVGGAIMHMAGTGLRSTDPLDAQREGIATTIPFSFMTGLAYEPQTEVLYVSISGKNFGEHHVIRVVNVAATGTATVRGRNVDAEHTIRIAGGNGEGSLGDGTLGIQAQLSSPASLSLDEIGNLWFVDQGNNVVRAIDTNGFISRQAGNYGSNVTSDGLSADATFAGIRAIADAGPKKHFFVDTAAGSLGSLAYSAVFDCSNMPCVDCDGNGNYRPIALCPMLWLQWRKCTRDCVSYRHLGVAGMEVTVGRPSGVSAKPVHFLVDPYFSRVKYDTLPLPPPFDNTNVNSLLTTLDINWKAPFISHILVTHTHYDHLADVPCVFLRSIGETDCDNLSFTNIDIRPPADNSQLLVIGSDSTLNVLSAYVSGRSQNNLGGRVLAVSDTRGAPRLNYCRFENHVDEYPDIGNGQFSVGVRPYNSLHALQDVPFKGHCVPFDGNVTATPSFDTTSNQISMSSMKEGGSLSYLLRIPKAKGGNYFLYIQGGGGSSYDDGKMNQQLTTWIVEQNTSIDTAIMPIVLPMYKPVATWPEGWRTYFDVDVEVGGVKKQFRPQNVIPVHYDKFGTSNPAPADTSPSAHFMFSPCDFKDAVKDTISPNGKVTILRFAGLARQFSTDENEGSQTGAVCDTESTPGVARTLWSDDANEVSSSGDPSTTAAWKAFEIMLCGFGLCPYIDRW
ncbi:MAG: hypothetical protein HY897_07560 [Deltaproteobacteria bacterium]|nr:hypothetical protein [Deltaproteobacteria bacterium]